MQILYRTEYVCLQNMQHKSKDENMEKWGGMFARKTVDSMLMDCLCIKIFYDMILEHKDSVN